MLNRFRAWVSREKPANAFGDALPPELQTVIAAAQIIERAGPEEYAPRLLVQTARGSIWNEAGQVHAWLTANWPDLSFKQQARAKDLLGARIAEAHRERLVAEAARNGTPRWRDWKPASRLWREGQ